MEGGYLSYITDDREQEYWRPYVGQSDNLRLRIRQHIRALCNNEASTLHYFILWKGNGHRIANFIRLWAMRFPSHADKAIPMILANILEMFMARAFGSLANGILETFFGRASYSGVGLNVVPPLLQGIGLSPSVRSSYSLQLGDSPDPEIAEWPRIRQQQRTAEAEDTTRMPSEGSQRLSHGEYLEKLVSAIKLQLGKDVTHFDPNVSLVEHRGNETKLQSLVDECAMDISKNVGAERTFVLPTGSTEARIGIVLDHNVDLSTGGEGAQKHTVPPWGISESGFDESNLLIWPFNLQQATLSSASHQARPLSDVEEGIFSRFNHKLVEATNLRVILLCGSNATKSMANSNKISLEFRGLTFNGYVELADGRIRRIYISAEPLAHLWANNWRQAQKISELFRFAWIMTGTKEIRDYACHSAVAQATIIRLYDEERNGRPKMTVDTIDPGLLTWLHRKGFRNDQDVRHLENVAGGLVIGALMLMVVLPACPTRFRHGNGQRLVPPSRIKRQNVFDRAKLNEVKKLYQEKSNPEVATESSTGRAGPMATAGHSTTELDQEIELEAEVASNLLGDVPDRTAMRMIKALAREKEPVSPSSDNLDDPEEGFYDMVDPQDVNELIAASEQDKIECAEMSSDGGQVSTMRSSNLNRPKRVYNPRIDAVPGHVISKQALKTQAELLSGRFYRGNWQAATNIRFEVHSTVHLVVHTSKANNPDGIITRAEIQPYGEKHPNAWATQARDDDPAIRLGFRVTAKDDEKRDYFTYPRSNSPNSVMRANAFVEWMAGDSDEVIASRPRRFVLVKEHIKHTVSDKMKIFVGGAYTDDNGVPYKTGSPKKRPLDTDGAAEEDLWEDLEALQMHDSY